MKVTGTEIYVAGFPKSKQALPKQMQRQPSDSFTQTDFPKMYPKQVSYYLVLLKHKLLYFCSPEKQAFPNYFYCTLMQHMWVIQVRQLSFWVPMIMTSLLKFGKEIIGRAAKKRLEDIH